MIEETAGSAPLERRVMQHTPGPWKWDYSVSIKAGDCLVALVYSTPLTHNNLDANARLIEAAPDMANALLSLLRHAERVNEVLAQECGARFLDDGPLGMARDALARAVGAA